MIRWVAIISRDMVYTVYNYFNMRGSTLLDIRHKVAVIKEDDMGFNDEDREWMDKCITEPCKHKLKIKRMHSLKYGTDYTAVYVIDDYSGTILHKFAMYDQYFIAQLLDYAKCNVEDL